MVMAANEKKIEKDPLATLFKNDARLVDREQLASLVRPFLSIDQETREFSFLPAFSHIKGNTSKIELLLAGAKARSLYLNEPDGLSAGDIILFEIMASGSCKSSLKKLYDSHKIKKDKERRSYYLPSYRIPELIKQFSAQSS